MKRVISLLRGINMTGHNSMRMNDLLSMVENLGFINVKTYIQSGNVIFSSTSDLSESDISDKIAKAIYDKFNYRVPVMIRTIEQMNKIVRENPFAKQEQFDISKMMAIFLYKEPTEEQIQKVIHIEHPPDKFLIVGREIYVYCPNGFGKTKLYTNFFEKKMSVTGTARNWKTITNLLDLAKKSD